MRPNIKRVSALSAIAAGIILSGARSNCDPTPPATCNPDSCCRTYCLGPENIAASAAVNPVTCNGDWIFTVAGIYWNAHQDGMEYAIESQVNSSSAENRTNLIRSEYKNPHFNWEFGFKIGLGYNTTCDGWDLNILWTRYNGKASSHDESEVDDNSTLLPLWSDFVNEIEMIGLLRYPTFATDIQTNWDLDLDLIDLELGRDFWNSKRVAIRPHIGLRLAYIDQDFKIFHKGGSWSITIASANLPLPANNEVEIKNYFKSVGIRGGLNTVWNVGCGFAAYGDTAFSILYGRFTIDHNEQNRDAESPFHKTKILETYDTFRASKLAVDLGLGIQWTSLFCDCQYGFTAKLGWENHLFLDQNQMFRVTKLGYLTPGTATDTGTNDFSQRRGDLSTQGWTLTFIFDY